MARFKAGDRIRRTWGHAVLERGRVYTVRECGDWGVKIDEFKGWFCENFFVLDKETKVLEILQTWKSLRKEI